jgi:ABC-type multidrug transport system permease subunit
LWQLTVSLFRELIREPGVLFWGIAFPILMSLGLGMAFTRKADILRKVAVIPSSGTTITDTSSLYLFLDRKCEKQEAKTDDDPGWKFTLKEEKLSNSVFLFYSMEWDEAIVKLKRGTVNLILKEENGITEYHFDPMNSDAELTFLKLHEIIDSKGIKVTESEGVIRPLTIEGTRYIDFLVPGLLTLGVMMSTMWGISYGLIEKRSKKLLRRLVATPMRKSHFLVALMTVRLTMNIIEALVLLVFAMIAFKLKIQGSIAALFVLFIAGNIAFSGIAILFSSHTSNTEVGNGIINAVTMPMMILSGIFFSYHNFPDWSIGVIQKLPLTMLTDSVRSILNEGAGFPEVAMPVAILSGIGVICFSTGLKIFKWH